MTDDLRIGFGTAVITPGVPVDLAGYFDRPNPATSVHDDLEVRVLVATDGDTTLALCSLDLMALSEDWATPLRDEVAAAVGTTRAAVVTSCIHTHAAPSTLTGSDQIGWRVPVEYRAPLTAACVDAARRALAAAEPARLAFARAPLPADLSFNRRGHPYDPTFAVVDITRPDGSRLGTLTNAGVHAVVLGPRNLAVSADWVGVFRRAIEEVAGGTAVFLQGCEGDVDPEGRCWEGGPQDWFDATDRVGNAFASAAADALRAARPVEGPLRVAAERRLAVPVGASGLAALAGNPDSVEVELLEWDLVGIRLVTVPGEGFSGLAAEVLSRRPDPLLLVGLAPHWLGYLPLPFTEGYEEELSYGEAAVAEVAAALCSGP